MEKIEKADRMIALLNQAEALAKELDISDQERFDGLRYWANLAKEMAEEENKKKEAAKEKSKLDLDTILNDFKNMEPIYEAKFFIVIPYWWANLHKAGVMQRIKVDGAELLDVEVLIGEGGRPRGFANIYLRFENELSTVKLYNLRAKIYSQQMRLSEEVPLHLTEDCEYGQKTKEMLERLEEWLDSDEA